MEDADIMQLKFAKRRDQAFFGIFDGHYGPECADYIARVLPQTLKAHALLDSDPSKAIYESFISTDRKFLRWAVKYDVPDGSTAITALLRDKKLYIANLGDSRCVMCKNGNAFTMTTDHTARVPEEIKRVEEAGGQVKHGRVQGKLTVTRAFGDLKFKNKEQLGDGYLTCKPDLVEIDITTDVQYVLLACDGLWEKVSAATAVRYINKKLQRGVEVEEITKELVKQALSKGSTDNVTVMLLVFDHFDKPLPKSQQRVRLVPGAVTTNNTDSPNHDSTAKSASSMNRSDDMSDVDEPSESSGQVEKSG
jgi:serine/threonine protein phosphatase PrpC